MPKNTAPGPTLIIALVIILLLTLATINILGFIKKTSDLYSVASVEARSDHEVLYWEGLVLQNPNYIEGWIELAKVKNNSGDLDGGLAALESATKIDPNSKLLENY